MFQKKAWLKIDSGPSSKCGCQSILILPKNSITHSENNCFASDECELVVKRWKLHRTIRRKLSCGNGSCNNLQQFSSSARFIVSMHADCWLCLSWYYLDLLLVFSHTHDWSTSDLIWTVWCLMSPSQVTSDVLSGFAPVFWLECLL